MENIAASPLQHKSFFAHADLLSRSLPDRRRSIELATGLQGCHLSEEQKDFATTHRAEDEGLRLELEALKKAYRDKEAELVRFLHEADTRQDSLLSEVERWKAACSEYRTDGERLRKWSKVRQRVAPKGSIGHFLIVAARALTARISEGRAEDARVDQRNMDLLLTCEEPNISLSPKLSGFICVSGWAAPKRKISSIRILVNGACAGNAFYGFARPDVVSSHPEFGRDVHIGFAFRLDATKLSARMHSLKVVATSIDGKTAAVEGDFEVTAEQVSQYPYADERQNALSGIPTEVTETLTEASVGTSADMVQASVMVFTRNQAEFLSRSLPVILGQQTSFRFEVIGFDTDSDDGTPHVFRRHGVRVVSVRRNEFHHMRTRLRSLREARGAFVIFLVGDALPADDHWLEALVRPLIDDPVVAAAYSRQLPAPGCVPWEARDIYQGCSVVREVKQVDWSQPAEVENYRKHQWKFISFSDVSACYRRELLESVPVLEALPQVEDQYWCKCLLEGGYRVVLEPMSLVIHSHNHSMRELYRRQVTFGRCFATFMEVQPEPMYKLVFKTVQETVNDVFFIVGSKINWLRRCKWILETPVMRFVKRYGIRRGFRLGAFGDDRFGSYKFASAQTAEVPSPTDRSK